MVLEQSTSKPIGRSRLSVSPQARVIRGRADILRHQSLLDRMCEQYGQQGEADNLEHFLTIPIALRKLPVLLLLPEGPDQNGRAVDGWAGAALLFEYTFKGVPLRLYASADWTGRRNLLADVGDRPALAARACHTLICLGAQAAFLSFHSPAQEARFETVIRDTLASGNEGKDGWWSLSRREVPLYLPLESTFDRTVAKIGQRTRSNLRYYRRRVEAQLGAHFVADVQMSLEEMLAFNRESSFPAPESLATARYQAIRIHRHPFLCGVRAADGQWLSLVMGWYRHNAIEIEWQINRADLREYSLSTVMRSFLIDHAISRGCERLYIEGGTRQPIQQSFQEECGNDLVLMRRSPYARFLRRYAERVFPADNHLGSLLANRELRWEAW